MTPDQHNHVKRIKASFGARMEAKYTAGAAEHGGTLLDMPAQGLAENALEEAIDLVVYLSTLLDKPLAEDKHGIHPAVLKLVVAEMQRAVTEHGKLTDDPFHAMTILMEELGEASAALLKLRRARAASDAVAVPSYRSEAVQELAQVASVTIFIMETLLRSEGSA